MSRIKFHLDRWWEKRLFSGSQERKYTEISMDRNMILAAFWRYLRLIWVIQNFFVKQFTAIEMKKGFEIYLRFISI